MIESLLLTAAHVRTFEQQRPLTNASGFFFTEARTHRGTSGAPVVMRLSDQDPARGELLWMLLGVHSARLEVGKPDLKLDEALGLNCAW